MEMIKLQNIVLEIVMKYNKTMPWGLNYIHIAVGELS